MASLTPAQLAAATPVDASKPTQSLPCFDAPRVSRAGGGALAGTQPTLDHARVYTHAGESLKDKRRTAMLLLAMPIMKALGVASEEKMELLSEEGEKQEQGASGSAASKKLFGAIYFLTESLDLLRGHLKETGSGVILPDPAVAGKSPSGGGRAGPAGATSSAPVGTTPPTPATPAAPLPAAAPIAAPAAAAPILPPTAAPALTAGGSAAPTTATVAATNKQTVAANEASQAKQDKDSMELVGATTGNNEVSVGFILLYFIYFSFFPRSGCLLFRTLAIFTRGFSRHEHFVRAVEGARLTAYSARSGRARRAHGAPPDHISPRLIFPTATNRQTAVQRFFSDRK